MNYPLKNTKEKYGLIARGFHWLIALLIFCLLIVGFFMGSMSFGPDKLQVIGLHKSFGIAVLFLGALRIIWRTITPPPPSLSTHAWYEKILAKTIHIVFYFCIIAMPLSGWVMSSAGEYPVRVFGVFNLPAIAPKNHDLFEAMKEVHELLAYGLIASILLHIVGAVKHQIIERDATMQRMGASLPLAALGILFLAVIPFLPEEPKGEISSAQTKSVSESSTTIQEASAWVIDHAASTIGFTFTQSGQAVTSTFEKWSGQIVFDKNNLAAASAKIIIDPSSIKTGSADRDEQALGADWFAVSEFPEVIFESESFTDLGSNQYRADGTLTMRGVKAPVSFLFSLEFESLGQSRKRAVMNADLVLKRLDFGLGQGGWQATDTIAADVKIHLHVEADEKNSD
jgi:cytochrome b561/polyisoprenoid-binding protein YceI